ncbi:MAG: YebC/PmpR family DNA-binding transcriptional regulator [Candidatus Shapirobacteria bacterium]
MSGHSKWANIKNRKGAVDKKRSEVFTKLSRAIIGAIKLGGGVINPESNSYLKVALDKAREANVPKDNIERLLGNYQSKQKNLMSLLLEGYGPGGVPMMVKVETDNKNRSLGEIRSLFKTYGGSVGDEGSVKFQFEEVGVIDYEGQLSEEEELQLMEKGMSDWTEETIEYGVGENGEVIKKYLEEQGKRVVSLGKRYKFLGARFELSQEDTQQLVDLIDELEALDEVESVNVGSP